MKQERWYVMLDGQISESERSIVNGIVIGEHLGEAIQLLQSITAEQGLQNSYPMEVEHLDADFEIYGSVPGAYSGQDLSVPRLVQLRS